MFCENDVRSVEKQLLAILSFDSDYFCTDLVICYSREVSVIRYCTLFMVQLVIFPGETRTHQLAEVLLLLLAENWG